MAKVITKDVYAVIDENGVLCSDNENSDCFLVFGNPESAGAMCMRGNHEKVVPATMVLVMKEGDDQDFDEEMRELLKKHQEAMDAEPPDHTDDVCTCGDPDCKRPLGHKEGDDNG
jgi:hypothetical protein